MSELFLNPEFWAAIAQFAWPVAIVIVALLFRKFVARLLRSETLTIKVAGMEISVKEATQQAGKGISDLQERVALLEQNFAVGKLLEQSFAIGKTAEGTPSENRSMSILWVDDYPSNNAFIIERLEGEGMRVRKELTTDAGISAMATDKFDVIISDLGRKEGGRENRFAGLDLARAIRAAGYRIPILIFAGQRGVENRERLLSAGATAVTTSAIDVFKFVEAHRSSDSHNGTDAAPALVDKL